MKKFKVFASYVGSHRDVIEANSIENAKSIMHMQMAEYFCNENIEVHDIEDIEND